MANHWENAYENTASVKQLISYRNICKNCNEITENKPTTERQQLGNQVQNIVTCKKCNLTFVDTWGFNHVN